MTVARFKLRASFAALVEFDTALLHIAHWASAAFDLKAISAIVTHTAIKKIFRLRRLLFIMTFGGRLAFKPVTQVGRPEAIGEENQQQADANYEHRNQSQHKRYPLKP